jgi:hypothetical protein
VEEHTVAGDVCRRIHASNVQVLRVGAARVRPAGPDEVLLPVLVLKHGAIDGPVVVRGRKLADELEEDMSIKVKLGSSCEE